MAGSPPRVYQLTAMQWLSSIQEAATSAVTSLQETIENEKKEFLQEYNSTGAAEPASASKAGSSSAAAAASSADDDTLQHLRRVGWAMLNPLEDQDFATACVLCPLNSVTLQEASTKREDCVCSAPHYDANASLAVDTALIANMIKAEREPVTMIAAVVDCLLCPIGTSCDLGSTLEGLPLTKGYYRLERTTVDVRWATGDQTPDHTSRASI